jgi:hypothetical protein
MIVYQTVITTIKFKHKIEIKADAVHWIIFWKAIVSARCICLSKVQNAIFERGAHPMIVATRAAQQPGLLVQKHSARGEDLHWNEGFLKQHDKTHNIKIEMTYC